MTRAFLAVLLLLPAARLHADPLQEPQATPAGIASLGIRVTEHSREYSFTNKESSFLYGETSGPNKQSGQGFNVFGHEFLDDYILLVDGVPVDRTRALVTVYPDVMVREYPGGVKEVIRMTDSLAAFAVSVSSPRPVEWSLLPLFADARSADAYVIALSSSMASLARAGHQTRTIPENYPAWLTIAVDGFTPAKKSFLSGGRFSPVELHASRLKKCTIVFSVGDTREGSESIAKIVASSIDALGGKRRARMEHLLASSEVHTGNDSFDRAFRWAILSLDALVMNQVTKGIFAGLPWFNNYWGRDSFISLPGATLVTGQFAEARSILRSFAEFQLRDSASTDFGRIPNIVTTSEKAYNTADGTPRFVMMLGEYTQRSGDSLFLLEMYPTVLRSIEGTLRYHCDSLGFLTHRDAETWMDAVGPDGPWSPRGNRANDIQALWAGQLFTGIEFATRLGDVVSARRWNDRLTILRRNFPRYFVLNGEVADRLTPEGKPDMRLRPNQIFACPLLDDSTRARVVDVVTSRLTYPYGVASLSQDDPGFHPYHQYPSSYPKDAAYHNGTVWTWLQGRVISELCGFERQDLAYQVTANTVHQILDRGAVGTQSELLDAIARPGEKEPRLSGTFSQAWNLAEFVRNFYDDFLGIRLDRERHRLTIVPRVPEEIGSVSARINLDGPGLRVQCTAASRGGDIMVSSAETGEAFIVRSTVRLGDGTDRLVTLSLPPRMSLRLSPTRDTVRAYLDDAPALATVERLPSATRVRLREDLSLAEPVLTPGLVSLRGPNYPLIPHERIIRTNPRAQILIDATDPANDDTVYAYPRSPDFVQGSFDIRRLTVAFDSSDVYFTLRFRSLSDPGWHPEYGTQLTFSAIALNLGDRETRRASVLGRNAALTLDSASAYDRVIFVGGGVQVEDASGTILGAYLPAEGDAVLPMGNAREGTIRFALPRSMLGTPSRRWRLTLLTGAQDDHGGSGLGEFRTVNREPGDWNGGGRVRPDQSNVYDRLWAVPK